MREKYTRAYFLKEDADGGRTIYGAEGVDDFKRGGIREQDLEILKHIHYEGKNVLEFGFGRGEAIKYALDNKASKVVGVDFSQDVNAIAKAHLKSYGLQAELHCLDAMEFFKLYSQKQENTKFDIVIMLDFVEHVPRSELTEILSTMHNWLTDKALLVINTPVYRVDNDVIVEGLNPLAKDTSDEVEETVGMHCNRYTKRSLSEYLHKHGYYALSGHFFCTSFRIVQALEGTLFARWIAIKNGYPILESAIFYIEHFEYATTWDEIKKREGSRKEEIYWLIKREPLSVLNLVAHIIKHNSLRISKLIIQAFKKKNNVKQIEKHSPEWITISEGVLKGSLMLLDLGAEACWQNEMFTGLYDSFIYDELDTIVNLKGSTVWDVGAHIGYHTLSFAIKVGSSGHVVAFEPNPHNFDRLHQNVDRNMNLAQSITLMSYALGDKDGEEEFVFSSDVDSGRSSGSHLSLAFAPEKPEAYESFTTKNIQLKTADSLIKDKNLPIPSIIKIDVEGAEASVLIGAQKLLFDYKPILLIEVHHIAAMHDTLNILFRYGYNTKIIKDAPYSSSRCFIIARV